MNTVKEQGADNPIEYISCLRIFATIAVIWLHTCSTLTDNREYFEISDMQYSFYNYSEMKGVKRVNHRHFDEN